MMELEFLGEESIELVSITPENDEVHIKYESKFTLVIFFGRGPVKYSVTNPNMELVERNVIFEEDLAALLNSETKKAMNSITTNFFQVESDHKKETFLDLCDSDTPATVKEMLVFLANLHSFFNDRLGVE